jgi:putative tRNA adenosine deaminase-associated protein
VPVGPDGSPLEPVVPAQAEEPEADLDEDAELELEDEEYAGPGTPSGPAGDAALLADFGRSAKALIGLCDGRLTPADALSKIAGWLGAAEELEAVR